MEFSSYVYQRLKKVLDLSSRKLIMEFSSYVYQRLKKVLDLTWRKLIMEFPSYVYQRLKKKSEMGRFSSVNAPSFWTDSTEVTTHNVTAAEGPTAKNILRFLYIYKPRLWCIWSLAPLSLYATIFSAAFKPFLWNKIFGNVRVSISHTLSLFDRPKTCIRSNIFEKCNLEYNALLPRNLFIYHSHDTISFEFDIFEMCSKFVTIRLLEGSLPPLTFCPSFTVSI